MLRSLTVAAVMSCAASLAACSKTPSALPDPPADISLSANVSGTAIAKLVVTVTAADIVTPLVFNLATAGGTVSGTFAVPAGSQRTFRVEGYDAGMVLTHEGSRTTAVTTGANSIAVALSALVGEVEVGVTLGSFTVAVSPASDTLVRGETRTLTAQTGGAAPAGGSFRWASRNPAVATVDEATGVVTAISRGSVEIVATYRGVAGVGYLTVTP